MLCIRAQKKDLDGVSFNCGLDYIDKYFQGNFLSDSDAVPYCFWMDETKQELIGIASLSCSGIIVRSSDHFNLTPAVEVKVFAIDEFYQHKPFPEDSESRRNWSDYCLDYLIECIYSLTENACGAGHVVLYSVDTAVSFYKRNKFQSFKDLMEMPSNYQISECIPMFLNL